MSNPNAMKVMTKDGDHYVTDREILNVFAFEIRKLDEEIWPRENGSPSRVEVLAHFERLKHELLKVSRTPRRVFVNDSDRQGAAEIVQPEPSDWESTAQADFERNKQRYYEKARSHRSAHVGLGSGESRPTR